MPISRLQDDIRALCSNIIMNDDAVLCRTLGRYKVFADKTDFGLSAHLMLDGFWQMWVTRALIANVREGMFVADVGAGIGYYSLLLADLAGQTGHVYAVEPNVRAMKLLERSIILNGFSGRVSIHDEVSVTPGQEAISRLKPLVGESKKPPMSPASWAKISTSAQAPNSRIICLDDVIQEAKIDFIKIDAKGAEREVWRGMQRIIARNQPLTIFLEFFVGRYQDPDLFLKEFGAANFKLTRVNLHGEITEVSINDILNFPPGAGQTLSLSR